MQLNKKSPAVFLDRDGVIIIEKRFQADPNAIEFVPGSIEGLKLLNRDFLKVVVSNQSGIARGYFTGEQAVAFNNSLNERMVEFNVQIDGWYFCPHGPSDNCNCRKPKAGMILDAAEDLNIDLSKSWIIGDKSSDIGAGMASGLKTILVQTGYAGKEPGCENISPDYVVDDLYCAIEIINKGVQI